MASPHWRRRLVHSHRYFAFVLHPAAPWGWGHARYRVGVRASGDGEAAVRWEEALPGLLTHTLTGLASSAAYEVSVLDVLTGVASDALTMRTATPDAQ